MKVLFLKSLANALSKVANVRAPLTIANAKTWRSFDWHSLAPRKRSSSYRSWVWSADLSLPARSNCKGSRCTSLRRTSSSLSLPDATKRGSPRLPRSQVMSWPGFVRNSAAAFASTMRHTSNAQEIPFFAPEELAKANWRISDGTILVQFKIVNRGSVLVAFEIQKRDVFGTQITATNFHTNSVNEVVAMSLDDKPPVLARLTCEKSCLIPPVPEDEGEPLAAEVRTPHRPWSVRVCRPE